jgi:RimJ/RimL family protein N-acetyltransferase
VYQNHTEVASRRGGIVGFIGLELYLGESSDGAHWADSVEVHPRRHQSGYAGGGAMNQMKSSPSRTVEARNRLGQPIGFALPGWTPPARPDREPMHGRFCRLEPLDAGRHAAELHEANGLDREQRMWTYLSYGPFDAFEDYAAWVHAAGESSDPLFFAVVELRSNRAVGVVSFLRIDPPCGSIEVGHLAFSPLLQRTPAATEAMFLMMKRAFELGYRRYEWKCDALNAPSRGAALRLGFSFEGVFRQATVYKQRSRDTAWYSILDREWPPLEAAFRRWLAPENFDADGKQKTKFSDIAATVRGPSGCLY